MQQQISLKLLPSEAANEDIVRQYIAQTTGKKITDITGFHLLRLSIDARGKHAYINLSIRAFINEPFLKKRSTKS